MVQEKGLERGCKRSGKEMTSRYRFKRLPVYILILIS